MEIQAVSEKFVAFIIHAGEILSSESCCGMVQKALEASGLSPWHGMSISCFAGKDDTLYIASPLAEYKVTAAEYAPDFIKEYFT